MSTVLLPSAPRIVAKRQQAGEQGHGALGNVAFALRLTEI